MVVTGLYVYPLKSARALSLERVSLDAFGFQGDRRWSVVGADGRVITQRECPALARLVVCPLPDAIELRTEGRESLRVERPAADRSTLPVDVWADRTEGASAGPAADAWLSEFLGVACRLVYMPSHTHRQVSLEFGRQGDRVSFADGYPVLLTSAASLAELNRRLDVPVPMNRFRPNLVIDGTSAFAEDAWARIRVGECEFRVVKPCGRCVVTTTDQQTGSRGKEPLRTLATFRRVDGKILFGQNLVHDGPGTIRLDDPVAVLERREEIAPG
ncbi:MAG: MOSC domain-containing protein [Candidatus Palauibacterales bacterium]|nr:MOSC domain-containing protein [Candidatus Palauibacterales bacterium]